MLKEKLRMSDAQAWAFLDAAAVVRMAGLMADGRPLVRTLHHACVDGTLYVHGGPKGEKVQLCGQTVVATAETSLVTIPSYFFDAERACPATTFFQSVEVRGRLETVDDPDEKARGLEALMNKLQSEGGHRPIDPSQPDFDRLYRNAVAGLWVGRLRPTSIVGKDKRGQHKGRATMERVLEGLWRRGETSDVAAIEAIRDAHEQTLSPAFLKAPDDAILTVQGGLHDLEAAVGLVADEYWNVGNSKDTIAEAHRHSAAWVGLRMSKGGPLIGTARAVADGQRHAYLADIAVRRDLRGRGWGRAMVRLLLDHPRVRNAAHVLLRTQDAQDFYAELGFGAYRPEIPFYIRTSASAA